MATQVKFSRVDLAANFTAANPVLGDGEIVWEKDTARVKVGDGVTAYNALPYRFETTAKEFFQASQTAAQVGIGAAEVTMTASQNQNSNGAVFSYAAGILTINKTGTFEFTYRVLADTATGAREHLLHKLQLNNADIPSGTAHSRGASYHRNNQSGEGSAEVSLILSITSGDTVRVRMNSPSAGVTTIPEGTGLIVKEL